MAEDFSGITGVVEVEGTPNPYRKWSLSLKSKLVDRSSPADAGQPRRAKGRYDGTLTLEGPWRTDTSPLTVGEEYVFTNHVDDDNAIEFTGRVESMDPGNDYDDGPSLKVVVQASDDITLTLPQLVLA